MGARDAFDAIAAASQGTRNQVAGSYLSDAEIADICAPLVMPSAQRRYLERLGMMVKAKPNGRPLLARGEFERVMIGRRSEEPSRTASEPNRAALLEMLTGGKSRGTKA